MPRASTFASPRLLLPLAALLATLPLMLHGNSCGQDLTFHLQSWLDAARQLRHGHYPHWDIAAAWNAGEPRFLFYPPISWLLGATLTLILPISAAPIAFIFIALLASGLSFHKLGRHFVASGPALISSALYLANPYMLFNAFERSALAELLAAAWIPLLLLAILRPRPTVRGIAIPLALLWLTNAPAAVMGSYLLALLAVLRVLHALFIPEKISLSRAPINSVLSTGPRESEANRGGSGDTPVFRRCPPHLRLNSRRPCRTLTLTLTYLAGTLLGLALPAFYLIPAAYERRFIQVDMAITPPLRYQDNFLFTHTSDAAHNAVNHTASLLTLTLLLTTFAFTALLLSLRKPPVSTPAASSASLVVLPLGGSRMGNLRLDRAPLPLAPILALLTLLIAFLLTPLSAPIWRHLPELAFLQFPWRLLTLLTPILALLIALLLDRFYFALPKPSSSRPPQISSSRPERSAVERPLYSAGAPPTTEPHRGMALAIILTLALPLTLSLTAHHFYAQPCDPADTPAILAHNLATHHGILPTDEYTPTTADNDLLRTGNPGFWLAPLGHPNAPAPNTVPTATELNPSIDTDDTPVPLSQTLSSPAPHHLTLHLPRPVLLVLNLRAYPNWHITVIHSTKQLPPSAQDAAQNPTPAVHVGPVQELHRNDGLLAIPLPSGPSAIDIAWRRSPDQTLGLILSAVALLLLLALTFRRYD